MLSTNGALLDGGASLAACLGGLGHLLSRRQIAARLARDPTFLYQASGLVCRGKGMQEGGRRGVSGRHAPGYLPCAPQPPCPPLRCLPTSLPPAACLQFQPLEGQSRGERDAEYLADMFRAG